jgi:hypothetical protein
MCTEADLRPYTPKYRPDEQTWRKLAGVLREKNDSQHSTLDSQLKSDLMVGWYKAAVPTCEDLQRSDLLAGPLVELADGRAWQVPLVRQMTADGESLVALPAYLDVDDDGQAKRGDVVDRHRWLLELVEPFWEAWCREYFAARSRVDALEAAHEQNPGELAAARRFYLDLPNLLHDAVRVLAANYRLGITEAAVMRLFRTDSSPIEVLKAACDCDFAAMLLEEETLLQKKTSPAATETSAASAT